MPDRAAFFRVEGVLLQRSALACAAWLAARQADLGAKVGRSLGALLTRPLAALGEPATALEAAWRTLDGCSEDRLVVLAEQYREDVLDEAWNEAGLALLDRCRESGERVVLVSTHPAVVLGDLAERLGADELVANHLELDGRHCTGKLVAPVVTGRLDGGWIRRYASRHGLRPELCAAYGATRDDSTLLSGVGRPCAVTPTRPLRRLAAELDWPVVDA